MHRSTLPRRARAHAPGWSHPYPDDLFSPVFYADGDQDADTDDADAAADTDGDADADKGDDAEADDADTDADPDGADDLGDKGKKALDAMKAKLKTERTRRREAEAKLKPADGDADQIQAKADAAATAKANARILRAEVKAAAAGKLADPADAYKFLDLDQFEVDDDGNVDTEEVAEAIEDLIKNKPYLAAATAKRFQGTGDGGAARKAGRPKQLTQQDLKSMSPEAIDKARIDGQLDDLMGGK
ncbi:hypothetical protein ACFWP7_28735 [Streptomyces sp. NPDC058470]|uniref:hypothetical protein n=1 Tax=Streptomyces sp. NPDC058470 TaxID=3346515 RepID=UPI00364BE908